MPPGVAVSEIARLTGMTTRTVYRDINALDEELGVPVLDEDAFREYRAAHALAPVLPVIRRLLVDGADDAGLVVAVGDAQAEWTEFRQALTDVGLAGAVKTSGAKGLHVFVPLKQLQALREKYGNAEWIWVWVDGQPITAAPLAANGGVIPATTAGNAYFGKLTFGAAGRHRINVYAGKHAGCTDG